jgi:hypothetical protein
VRFGLAGALLHTACVPPGGLAKTEISVFLIITSFRKIIDPQQDEKIFHANPDDISLIAHAGNDGCCDNSSARYN